MPATGVFPCLIAAHQMYRQAISIDPTDPVVLTDFGGFLERIRKVPLPKPNLLPLRCPHMASAIGVHRTRRLLPPCLPPPFARTQITRRRKKDCSE